MPQEPPSRIYDVIIVGGGASGTLLAIQLMRQARSGIRVALLDRAGAFGRGLAFSTQEPEHLLNTRAEQMSALPDAPEHFTRWLARIEPGASGEAFAPRRRYARYLGAALEEARRLGRRVGGRVDLLTAEAISIEASARGLQLTLAATGRLAAPSVVLAYGVPPPVDPSLSSDGALSSPYYARSPWTREAWMGVPMEGAVLLLGTGLTMIDVALSLRASGHRGLLRALSRHGLLPHEHDAHHPVEVELELEGDLPLSELTRHLRAAAERAPTSAEGADWRSIVDAMRRRAAATWRALSELERRRFLRHLRPYWETHRHRMPPSVARAVQSMQTAGQLQAEAGRLTALSPADNGQVAARWRRRSGEEAHGFFVRIINCTGPALAHDPLTTPLVASLFSSRLARPGPLGIALDTEGVGAVRDAAGRPSDRLFAIGPLRRGELWESTAVPEIRAQAEALARHLLFAN